MAGGDRGDGARGWEVGDTGGGLAEGKAGVLVGCGLGTVVGNGGEGCVAGLDDWGEGVEGVSGCAAAAGDGSEGAGEDRGAGDLSTIVTASPRIQASPI